MKNETRKTEQPCTIQNVRHSIFTWAVTGTFHGSLIEAESEGEARRVFHKHYNGESITHIKKKGRQPALHYA